MTWVSTALDAILAASYLWIGLRYVMWETLDDPKCFPAPNKSGMRRGTWLMACIMVTLVLSLAWPLTVLVGVVLLWRERTR